MTTRIYFAAFIALACCASGAFAQVGNYPNKPIRWVIPFQPGGGTDMVARPVAAKLTDRIGQQILYDNRGGGGGVIAGEIVANANPDGYTLLVAAVAVMTVTGSMQRMPFDPIKDFIPITKFANVPNMLAARTAMPISKVQEIVSYAKANPGKLRWASCSRAKPI
jgi:tripartite-type tricarboxylate transporter receptor subunit TctC